MISLASDIGHCIALIIPSWSVTHPHHSPVHESTISLSHVSRRQLVLALLRMIGRLRNKPSIVPNGKPLSTLNLPEAAAPFSAYCDSAV